MAEDKSLDIVGVGKLAKAIPQKAWVAVVETACETFQSCVAPLTKTTSGIGRLIEAKFDRLVDAEKVLAAEIMSRATEKANASKDVEASPDQSATSEKASRRSRKAKRPSKDDADIQSRSESGPKTMKVPIVVQAIEHSAVQTDEVLRELWSNLIAQEIVTGAVHPEFPGILAKLSVQEAHVLAEIAEKNHDRRRRYWATFSSARVGGVSFEDIMAGDPETFAHEHLQMLHLIRRKGGRWFLTPFGQAFTTAVSDPSVPSSEPAG